MPVRAEQPVLLQPSASAMRAARNAEQISGAQSSSENKTPRASRRPISETWSKVRVTPETSKENLGRQGNKAAGTPSRSPFQERRPHHSTVEADKSAKKVVGYATLCAKTVHSNVVKSAEKDSKHLAGSYGRGKSLVKNTDLHTFISRDPLGNMAMDGSDSTNAQPTINSLFSKLGNLSEKIHQVATQNHGLEARNSVIIEKSSV
jgi:hypothetical protein